MVTTPEDAVTDTVPLVPLPTTAVIVVGLTTVKELAGVPPKLTAEAPNKLVPVIVTVWPVAAVVGVKEANVAVTAGEMVNADALVAVPPGVVTVI